MFNHDNVAAFNRIHMNVALLFVQQFHMNLRLKLAEPEMVAIVEISPFQRLLLLTSLLRLNTHHIHQQPFQENSARRQDIPGEPESKPKIPHRPHMGYQPSTATTFLTTAHGPVAPFTGATGAGLSRTDSSFASLLWLRVLAAGPP